MKIILTGNTGFIGREVLAQCIANPTVTSVVALSRKPLTASHAKLKTILHEDFTAYPAPLMAELQGADACIWSLGIANPKTMEQAQTVNMDYTLSAARAFRAAFPGTFRFVYLSGRYAERDQAKKLWVLGEARKLRGRVELELLKLREGGFEVYVARPGFVTAKEGRAQDAVFRLLAETIPVDGLARAMIGLAEKGEDHEICEMEELVRKGKESRLDG